MTQDAVDAWNTRQAASQGNARVSQVEVQTGVVITDDMLNAHLKVTGEWVKPFEAEYEGGVQISCELTQEDADSINSESRDQLRRGYVAALDGAAQASAMTPQGALEIAANIAEAIDSGRGNEKEIASAIRRVANQGYWTRDDYKLAGSGFTSSFSF